MLSLHNVASYKSGSVSVSSIWAYVSSGGYIMENEVEKRVETGVKWQFTGSKIRGFRLGGSPE